MRCSRREGDATEWRFERRADTHEQLAEFERLCRDLGIDADPLVLRTTVAHQLDGVQGLTENQREALVLAHDRGYFSSSRTASLEGIATERGISRQSRSSRIRRGLFHLVGRTLRDDDDAR